jgi:hypothetical protein
MPLAWTFVVRTGDGNRIRAVSLGSKPNMPVRGAGLRFDVTVSARC